MQPRYGAWIPNACPPWHSKGGTVDSGIPLALRAWTNSFICPSLCFTDHKESSLKAVPRTKLIEIDHE